MESALQHALIEKAVEVAELLGSIADDYDRAWAQELNVRQYAISQRDEVGL